MKTAAAGLRVHPVHGVRLLDDGTIVCACPEGATCSRKPGKHPVLTGWTEAATTASGIIRSWFGPKGPHRHGNLGVVTGRDSGCFVVDVDGPTGAATLEAIEDQHGKLPTTLTAQTGSGGRHLVFRHPGWPVKNAVRIAPGLDIRGDGGQIVVEPSRHISGGIYSWMDGEPGEVEIVEAPAWLLEMVRTASGADGARKDPFKLDDEIPKGERNDRLFKLGCALRRQGMGDAEITGAVEAANGRCRPPVEAEELEAIVASVLRYAPGGNGSKPTGARPRVNAGEKDLARQTAATWKALHETNDPPALFRRGGAIVRIETDDYGRLTARAVDVERLRHHATDRIEFYAVRKTDKGFEELPARPPRDLIENLLATPGAKLPVLDRIVRAPCYTADATLIERPGFHRGSGILLDLGTLAVPPVSEQPSQDEVRGACEALLVEVLGDFPFLGPADRAAALALLLGPFARALISGPTPLHMVEKPTPGTGASLMLDCIALIATGGPAAVATEARDDDEWRKRITSILLTAPAITVLDNVRNKLDSGALSAAITAETWSDRRLGQNAILEMPVTCVWAATGNNPATSSEIARRTVPIRLDAKVDRPWEREAREFRHPSLKAWVAENRGALVHAALTMIRGWIAAGCPREDSVTLGSFERWAETMGGILRVAGVPGFLDNLPEFYDRADREGEAHRALVAAWWNRFGESVVGTAQLFPLVAEEEIPLDLGTGSDRGQKTRFGSEIRKLRDRRFGDLKVEALDLRKHGAKYRLVQDRDRARGEPGEDGEPFPPRVRAEFLRDAGAGAKGSPGSQGSPHAREPGDDDDEELRRGEGAR